MEVDDRSSPLTGLPASILELAGLDLATYRVAPLTRRTAACVRALRVATEEQASRHIRTDPSLVELALSTLLIGVSEFFRDPVVFQTLRTHVIPALQQCQGPLRVLSVGSSSGAELYSVAMLLAEASLVDRADMVGIDCRPDAIRQSETGVFHRAALAGLPEHLQCRFLEPVSTGWRVVERVRRRTTWHVADATRGCPPGPWNIVLCRNLAIYLQPRTADAMFQRLVGQLAPGGVLVVGKAERPPNSLSLTQLERCVYTTDAH